MLLLAQGLLSAVMVHRIPNAAVKDLAKARDGFWVPDLERISRLQHGKNLQKSLDTRLAKIPSMPRPMDVDIPLKGQVPDIPSSSVLLPHEMLHAMYLSAEGWESSVLPDPTLLPKLWETFSGHPCMQGHPIKDKPGWQTKAIPLCMHGDEVPVVEVGKIWSRSASLFSFFSMMATLAGRSAEDTNIYIWGCFEKFSIGTTEATLGTMDTFRLLLKWSFTILMEGKWPDFTCVLLGARLFFTCEIMNNFVLHAPAGT